MRLWRSTMNDDNENLQSSGGLDTLAEAMKVPPAEGEGNHFESEIHEIYTVTALEQAVVVDKDAGGREKKRTTTLWLHHRCRWYWNFVSYKSDCWAWITDAKTDGKLVEVDQIEAHLVHDSHFGTNRKIEKNASAAHCRSRHYGVGVPKVGITAWACAENSGFGRWCTSQTKA